MPIKLANNASARLAAPLSPTDVTVVLMPTDIQNFPPLSAGQWHPLTIVAATGEIEVMRVTARDANVLTVLRGREGTIQQPFLAGDRAELRLTAGAIEDVQDEVYDFALQTATEQVSGAVEGIIQANIDAARDEAITTSVTALADAITGTIQTNIDTAKSQAIAAASTAKTEAIAEADTAADAALATAMATVPPLIATAKGEAISAAQADATAQVSAENTAMLAAVDALRDELTADILDAVGDALALFPPGFGPLPWSLPTEPAGWIFADGRTLLSATPYTALRTAYINAGYPYGQDGTGNPKVPDMRGRVPAGLDALGGSAASRLTGATLGAGLGSQTHTLTTAQLPAHNHGVTDPGHAHGVSDPTHAHGVYDPGHQHTHGGPAGLSDSGYGLDTASTAYQRRVAISSSSGVFNTITSNGAATGIGIYGAGTGVSVNSGATGISTQNTGTGAAHNIVQPTLAVGYIVKT